MRQQWTFTDLGGAWLAPVFAGLLLVGFGVLVYVVPRLLEVIVAGMFIFAGCSLIAWAWHLRGRVSYRRIDDDSPHVGGPDEL